MTIVFINVNLFNQSQLITVAKKTCQGLKRISFIFKYKNSFFTKVYTNEKI